MISIDKRVNGARGDKQGRMATQRAMHREGSDVAVAHDRPKKKTTSAACLVKVVVHNHGNEIGEVP